jgi:hypothetical protein
MKLWSLLVHPGLLTPLPQRGTDTALAGQLRMELVLGKSYYEAKEFETIDTSVYGQHDWGCCLGQ